MGNLTKPAKLRILQVQLDFALGSGHIESNNRLAGFVLCLIEEVGVLRVLDQLVLGCFFWAKPKLAAGCVCKRRQKSLGACKRISEDSLLLAEKVLFKTPLQRGNWVQVPSWFGGNSKWTSSRF
jgi:hypothetical protein